MSRILIGALIALAALALALIARAEATQPEIICTVVPPHAPVDCSLKAALRGTGVPLECKGA